MHDTYLLTYLPVLSNLKTNAVAVQSAISATAMLFLVHFPTFFTQVTWCSLGTMAALWQ